MLARVLICCFVQFLLSVYSSFIRFFYFLSLTFLCVCFSVLFYGGRFSGPIEIQNGMGLFGGNPRPATLSINSQTKGCIGNWIEILKDFKGVSCIRILK